MGVTSYKPKEKKTIRNTSSFFGHTNHKRYWAFYNRSESLHPGVQHLLFREVGGRLSFGIVVERWGCNLYLRSHEVHADFETLNIYGKSLLRLPNGHAVLDIMDYDEKHVLDDPIFQPFLTGKKGSSALLAFEAVIPKDTFLSDRLARNDDEETTWVQEAIRSGTKGIYSKKVTTELDRLARTYRNV